MRPIGLLVIVFSFLFLSPSLSFAVREEAIDTALTEAELNIPSKNAYDQNSYLDNAAEPQPQPEPEPDITLRETQGASSDVSETTYDFKASGRSSKRREAIENALNNFYVSGGYAYDHLHYSEWQGRAKVDENFGSQNGLYINLGYKSNHYHEALRGKPFIEAYYRRVDGTTRYKGGTFDPETGEDLGPFNATQKSDITRFGAKVGTYMDFAQAGEAFTYLDLGRRVWNRGENEIVDGVSMSKEKYYWFYYGIGMGLNYRLLPKLSVGIDWTGWLTTKPTMHAYSGEGADFKLRRVWGTEVKIPIKYYSLKNFSLDVIPFYTFWHINESDIVFMSGGSLPLVEPDSNTNELGVMAGCTYSF